MTRQTTQPLEDLSLDVADRRAREIARSFTDDFGLDLNPPYQRGRVWSGDQKIALIRSWLTGTPTGVVIFNDRSTPEWKNANGYDPAEAGEAIYACIDVSSASVPPASGSAASLPSPPPGSPRKTSRGPRTPPTALTSAGAA